VKKEKIERIVLCNGNVVELSNNQFFEEYPNKVELWEKKGKLLYKIKGWYNKSIFNQIKEG